MVKVLFTAGTWPETWRTAGTAILMETQNGFSLYDERGKHLILTFDRIDDLTIAEHPVVGDILTVKQNGTLYTLLPVLYTNADRSLILPSHWQLRHIAAGFKKYQRDIFKSS